MREILFRGKRLDNDLWEEGSLIFPLAHRQTDDPSIGDFWSMVRVDPATVGQYTGLTDKNSVKIFEGDICEIDREYGTFEIIWDNRCTRFALVSDELYFDFDQFNSNEISVIGNIHDNPELLEVKNA